MASIVVAGDTSGTVTLAAPAVSGTTTLTLPTTSGTLVTTASGQTLNSPTIATPTITGQATIPTINLTGGQITFPAAQSASTDANTLDDYEEGTFTPTFVSATATYTNQIGHYTKIGNIVYFFLSLATSALTRSATGINIGGLPFTVGTDPSNEYYVPMSVFTQAGFNQTFATQGYSPLAAQGSTNITFYGQANGTGNNYGATSYNDLQTGLNWVRLAGFYKVT